MRTYQRYSVVAREGGHGNGLSVVVQGSLLRWVSPARGMLVVGGAPPPRELGPGSVFGEEVLLGDAPTPTPASCPACPAACPAIRATASLARSLTATRTRGGLAARRCRDAGPNCDPVE